MGKLTVIDFFCGAGGFSEGFRQQGFEIVTGIDSWQPAVDTFNHNFGLNCIVKNILDFENSIEEIESLPDTDVIIGSPPCVSFSNSNISGKADKAPGVLLIKTFLRIIAVKKLQKKSKLKAWFMENVTNSKKHLKDYYTLKDLGLSKWAIKNGYSPKKVVISTNDWSVVINSAEYGSPQIRKRVITGEIIGQGKFILPAKTNKLLNAEGNLPDAPTLNYIARSIPRPNVKKSSRRIIDPLYPEISIPLNQISDHFYDTGLYKCQWKNSYFMKRNHPYMGRMAFPENKKKPSRTVTATNIGTSREAIIYISEYNRTGDGEYRVPTVREMACLMGFPITYQFLGGSESSKCRLVGNAVCPSVSRALAKTIRQQMNLRNIARPIVQIDTKNKGFFNLNTFAEKPFDKPPQKNKGSRFRRHPFKYGNITVTLSNYDIIDGDSSGKWITSVQYGNGEGFPYSSYPDNFYKKVEAMISGFERGNEFIDIISNGFLEKIATRKKLQDMYEAQKSQLPLLEPTELIEEVARIIDSFSFKDPLLSQNKEVVFTHKKTVPKKQLMALYTINRIASSANMK